MIFWRSTLRLKYGSEKIQIIETKLFIYIYNLRFTLTKTYTANSTQQRKVKKKKKKASLSQRKCNSTRSFLAETNFLLTFPRKKKAREKEDPILHDPKPPFSTRTPGLRYQWRFRRWLRSKFQLDSRPFSFQTKP